MSYNTILNEKLEILHRCLSPPTDFLDRLDIQEKLYSIYQLELVNNNYVEVYQSLNNLFALSKSDVTAFDKEYTNRLRDFRDKLLKTSFNFIEIGALYKGINENVIINESNRLTAIIKDIYSDNKVLWKISHREFEEIIGELFREKNYQVELTKQTRDNGYDLIALKLVDGFPLKYLIECKRNRIDRPVGIQIIRSFNDVINSENANKGIIVTTSYFSQIALEKQQKTEYKLDLKDRIDIINWINEYCMKKYSR